MDTATAINLATGFLVACVFPFVLYFFKKNERLHEQTRDKVGQHDVTIAIHEVKIHSLEEWRNMQAIQQPPTITAVTNVQ